MRQILKLTLLVFIGSQLFSCTHVPQSSELRNPAQAQNQSLAQELYDKTKSGVMHENLVKAYLAANSGSSVRELSQQIRSAYNFKCTLNERLRSDANPKDVRRHDLTAVKSSLDPFDPGVSLKGLFNSKELARVNSQNPEACAESPRRTYVRVPMEYVSVYFANPDFAKYEYIANFSYLDLEKLARYRAQNPLPALVEAGDKLSPAERAYLETADRSASEEFYVARIPKTVAHILSQDVLITDQKFPGIGEKTVSHLQLRFVFNEPIELVPQRINSSGALVGEKKSLESFIFTTEANGLPGFNYDAQEQAGKDIFVEGQTQFSKGTFLNYYRFKSPQTGIRDSYVGRPNVNRKKYPTLQYSFTGPQYENNKNKILANLINLGLVNGSHLPYFLLSNNCSIGAFDGIDRALGTSSLVKNKRSLIPPKLITAIPWETHNAYKMRGLLSKPPQRHVVSQIPLNTNPPRLVPSEMVMEYCLSQVKPTLGRDPLGVCASFGY